MRLPRSLVRPLHAALATPTVAAAGPDARRGRSSRTSGTRSTKMLLKPRALEHRTRRRWVAGCLIVLAAVCPPAQAQIGDSTIIEAREALRKKDKNRLAAARAAAARAAARPFLSFLRSASRASMIVLSPICACAAGQTAASTTRQPATQRRVRCSNARGFNNISFDRVPDVLELRPRRAAGPAAASAGQARAACNGRASGRG